MADWSDYYSGQRMDSLARFVALRHHDVRVGGSLPGLGSFNNTVTIASPVYLTTTHWDHLSLVDTLLWIHDVMVIDIPCHILASELKKLHKPFDKHETLPNVAAMLVHCLRHWPNINPILGHCLLFTSIWAMEQRQSRCLEQMEMKI